jgi:hypothetical protein
MTYTSGRPGRRQSGSPEVSFAPRDDASSLPSPGRGGSIANAMSNRGGVNLPRAGQLRWKPPSLRADGSRECAPDGKLRDAIQSSEETVSMSVPPLHFMGRELFVASVGGRYSWVGTAAVKFCH